MANEEKTRNSRREAREAVFGLLFETEYHEGETPEVILERAAEERELDASDKYIRKTYLGVMARLEEIDAVIGKYAKGWKTGRLSRVSRAVLRLGTYEILFSDKCPAPVAINEAVELFKKFDDPASKTKSFVNGVLNAIKDAQANGEVGALLAELKTVAEQAAAAAEDAAEGTAAEETASEEAASEEASDVPASDDAPADMSADHE